MSNSKTIIVKFGGQPLQSRNGMEAFAGAVQNIRDDNGTEVIVVHGGGRQADRVHEKMDVPVRKINGRRETDRDALEIAKMVYGGKVNKRLVSLLEAHGVPAIGLTGVDGSLLEVTRRPPVTMTEPSGRTKKVDFGYVGNVKQVHTEPVEAQLRGGFVPVLGCLGIDSDGQVYNVNADSVASAVSAEMKADDLVYVTSSPGVRTAPDSSEVFRDLSLSTARKKIEKGQITGGMLPKIEAAAYALGNGVDQVFITGVQADEADWIGTLREKNSGTTITGNPTDEQKRNPFLSTE